MTTADELRDKVADFLQEHDTAGDKLEFLGARYDADALTRWAARLTRLEKPAFVYFRHDGDPEEAVRLAEKRRLASRR